MRWMTCLFFVACQPSIGVSELGPAERSIDLADACEADHAVCLEMAPALGLSPSECDALRDACVSGDEPGEPEVNEPEPDTDVDSASPMTCDESYDACVELAPALGLTEENCAEALAECQGLVFPDERPVDDADTESVDDETTSCDDDYVTCVTFFESLGLDAAECDIRHQECLSGS